MRLLGLSVFVSEVTCQLCCSKKTEPHLLDDILAMCQWHWVLNFKFHRTFTHCEPLLFFRFFSTLCKHKHHSQCTAVQNWGESWMSFSDRPWPSPARACLSSVWEHGSSFSKLGIQMEINIANKWKLNNIVGTTKWVCASRTERHQQCLLSLPFVSSKSLAVLTVWSAK